MRIMNFCFKCINKCYTPMKYINFDAYLITYTDHDLELNDPAEGNQRIKYGFQTIKINFCRKIIVKMISHRNQDFFSAIHALPEFHSYCEIRSL